MSYVTRFFSYLLVLITCCLKIQADPQAIVDTDDNDQCDLIIFSYNRPMQLYSLMESLEKRITNVRKIAAICRIEPQYESGYEIVSDRFPNLVIVEQSQDNPKGDFKPLLLDLIFGSFGDGADYILFAVDDIVVTDEFDVKEGIVKLQETGAYGLYYRLAKHIDYCYMLKRHQGVPPLQEVGDGYFTWRFKDGRDDWAYPNTVDLTLYRKADIKEAFFTIDYTYPNDMEGLWHAQADLNKIGLCCTRAKMVNIVLNLCNCAGGNGYSPAKLNEVFLQGKKIDIDMFYRIQNTSPHAFYTPEFISRQN